MALTNATLLIRDARAACLPGSRRLAANVSGATPRVSATPVSPAAESVDQIVCVVGRASKNDGVDKGNPTRTAKISHHIEEAAGVGDEPFW